MSATVNFDRYARQMALPECGPAQQKRLGKARILCIGAGGLGAAALPYMAGAGIGHITIIDHDQISISNLHRQTIYTSAQAGQSKSEAAARYLRALNPEIDVQCRADKLTPDNAAELTDFDLILDGSDNFETKTLANDMAIASKSTLITASVIGLSGQAGIFAGHYKNAPCYRCLFPELPVLARDCNSAGVLGTAAGITGMLQAHLALGHLIGLDGFNPGLVLSMDFKSLRQQKLSLAKNRDCPHCARGEEQSLPIQEKDTQMIEIIHPEKLRLQDCLIIDVRTDGEVADDPIEGALHIELSTLPSRYTELPQDKLLAFACAANVRSMQAAQFMQAMGYAQVCVYDKLAA